MQIVVVAVGYLHTGGRRAYSAKRQLKMQSHGPISRRVVHIVIRHYINALKVVWA